MEKKKGLFNFLTLGITISSVILFSANILGFSLNLSFNFIGKILGLFLLIALLLNLKNIKKFFINVKKIKSFFMLSFLNVALIFLFILLYSIFRFGSPLAFEDRITNFKASQKQEIVLGERLRQTFTAMSDNLGTIGVKILVKDEDLFIPVLDEEIGEIDEDEKTIRPLFIDKTDKIIFRIREDKPKIRDLTENFQTSISLFGIPLQKKVQEAGYIFEKEKSSNYFYEDTYEFKEDFQTSYLLFSFPQQKESRDKNYLFEIEKIGEGETGRTFLVEKNSDGKFNFYPRHTYSLREIRSESLQIISNISRKINQFLSEKSVQANLIIVFLLIEFFIIFFLRKEDKYFKEKINPYLKYGFLLGLFLITIASLEFGFIEKINYLQNTINNLSNYNLPLVLFTVFFGLSLLFFNKERIEKDVENEKDREDLIEETRFEEFKGKLPKLNKIPILGKFLGWFYKENWGYIAILIAIIMMFTVIKIPYFKIPFDGMKYNSYVEPAKYMYEHNNPFWNQKKYTSNPVTNPQGIYKIFGMFPFISWGLLLTYYIFPFNSLEFNTRLFTNFLGVLILLLGYSFFKKWLTKKQSLLVVFLMAINPIIHFISFKTVEDSVLIIFTLLSLIYLSKYIKKRNITDLFFGGLFFGIGIESKYSIFLWLAPIIFIFFAFNSKRLSLFLKDFIITIAISLIPIISFRTSLRYLPTSVFSSILKFIIWIIVFIGIYYFLKKHDRKLEYFFDFFIKRKIFFILGLIVIFCLGMVFFYLTGIHKIYKEFLTDSRLIFNWDMYSYMLNKQFKSYMTNNVYYLGLIGIIIPLLFSRLKKQRFVLLSFLFGSLFYWILASKVIFFHNYYTSIIMITFCLSIGIIINLINKLFKNKFLTIIVLLFFSFIMFPPSHKTIIANLGKQNNQEDIKEAAQYLIENTDENEIYIDPNDSQYLTILTNRAQTRDYRLDRPEIKKLIKEIGFSKTMDEYNISYIVTTKKVPEYVRYANFFTDEKLQSISYERTDLILKKLNPSYIYFSDIQKREELVEKFNIKEKFVLNKKIGIYSFFEFKD